MGISQISMNQNKVKNIQLTRFRKRVWIISLIAVLISILGFISSWFNSSIGLPLKPGLDFTGGTQIQLERICTNQSCEEINSSRVLKALDDITLPYSSGKTSPKLSQAKVQFLDDYQSVVIRLPSLTASQGKIVIQELKSLLGPFDSDSQSIKTIGPTLGKQLLRSSLISLLVAFIGIATYITIRYDRLFALLALVALTHDVLIVCGVFSWLGIYLSVEIDSLFAVALLTIAGYSVNDTVVVFDRIRERRRIDQNLSINEQIDQAVSSTFTRTLYTSGTTLLPLIALITFGGSTLYWFAIALAIGVIVGSWSSIALAPSLLSLIGTSKKVNKNYVSQA